MRPSTVIAIAILIIGYGSVTASCLIHHHFIWAAAVLAVVPVFSAVFYGMAYLDEWWERR
jgi:hypothetical protein